MPTDDPPTSPAPSKATASRGLLVALLALAASVVIIGIIVTRSDGGSEPPASAASPPSIEATTTTSTTLSARGEVTSRLREILQTRDRALLSRDASLLNEIYAIDCPCLKDGKALIDQLRKENIVWKSVRTNITIMNMEEVNNRLWIVVATVRTPSIRIETESGRLVRMVPAEHNTVRFALTRPQDKEDWLLGHASKLG